jgi:predicted nucleic-acid-binding protein
VISLDTNVLLRLWLRDDDAQFQQAAKLLAQHGGEIGAVFLCDVVLAEAVWALRTAYRRARRSIVFALEATLAEPAYAFEDRSVVEAALALYRASAVDFADCLVAAKGVAMGAEFTATFDRNMKGVPGVKILET